MDYGFPILVALWVVVVAILRKQWEVKWERFVKEMEVSLERPSKTSRRDWVYSSKK